MLLYPELRLGSVLVLLCTDLLSYRIGYMRIVGTSPRDSHRQILRILIVVPPLILWYLLQRQFADLVLDLCLRFTKMVSAHSGPLPLFLFIFDLLNISVFDCLGIELFLQRLLPLLSAVPGIMHVVFI